MTTPTGPCAAPDRIAATLAAERAVTTPGPGLLTDPDLHQPITTEARFTYRLGATLSSTWQRTDQHRLSLHVRGALLAAIRATTGHRMATLSSRQRDLLLNQPLWMVLPSYRNRYQPDIVLVDAEDRVVLVIEAKGPRTSMQATPAARLRETETWAPGRAAARFRRKVHDTDANLDRSHAPQSPDEKGRCTGCWFHNRGARRGESISAFHQCDAYRYARGWLPSGYTVHPEVVWLLLVPARTDPVAFFDGADSTRDWLVADIEALHEHLTRPAPPSLTSWEDGRLRDLTDGMAALYRLP